ncbi:MAG: phosphatidylserine decarboxylase [Rikenellaceae bacterium]
MSGTIEYFKHHQGDFLFANNPKSSTLNERTTIVVKHEGESIMFRQVAGYIARRIVTYVTLGHKVEQNERCGFIKFGSRVDLFLPLNYELNVKLNDKVVATKSIIAHKPKNK